MIEHHVRELLPAYISHNLDATKERVVGEHLAVCPDCRRELELTRNLWEGLGRMADEEPSPALGKNFREMVKAYELGMQRESSAQRVGRRRFLERISLGRPAFQAGLAASMVVAGFVLGYVFRGDTGTAQDIAQLHNEVRGLSNLLTVSLLHQESASERLKGVSWSAKLVGRDPEIDAALMNAMMHDRNVNVRLAALDALTHDLKNPTVRDDVIHALPEQPSPLMQMALVDVLAQINDRESRQVLRQALDKGDLHPDVRKRIIQELGRAL